VKQQVTCGEHEYTFEGFRRLIEDGCVDIVQPDIYRAGGITGLKKIATLAAAHHTKLVCHGIGAATYHFLSSLDWTIVMPGHVHVSSKLKLSKNTTFSGGAADAPDATFPTAGPPR